MFQLVNIHFRKTSILLTIVIGLISFNLIGSTFRVLSINVDKTQPNQKFPENFDEAVGHIIKSLSKEDINYIRNFPKYDLIMFHHGWGTGIRNSLGLWKKNHKLLKSCANKIGKESMHPDNASSMLINGVWDKLNKDYNLVDFKNIEPINYFNSIKETILKAKQENKTEYLASLPKWLYSVRRLNFRNKKGLDRNKKLLVEARKLIKENNTFSYLGVLYLVSYSSDIKEIESILSGLLEVDDLFVTLPSFNYKSLITKNMFLQRKTDKEISEKNIEYLWTKLSLKEFSIKCYGSLNNKNFDSVEDFKDWQDSKTRNYLVKWKYTKEIKKNDFERLLTEPQKLLEILTLTNKYFYFDKHNHGLTTGAYKNSKESIKSLISILGFDQNTSLNNYPYNKSISIRGRQKNNSQNLSYLSVHALSSIASKLSTEELLEVLSPNKIVDYNKNFKTDDLSEFKILGGFLLATQYHKIINYHDKEKAFQTCYYYWKNEHISWPMKYYITELLFQIDSKKALSVFLEYFKETPSKGSFTRNGILKSIIKYDFTDNKDFLENWYWTIFDKNFNYNPKEYDLILSLLKSTNEETFKLYTKITNDIRFKSNKQVF